VDSSLLDEWEGRMDGKPAKGERAPKVYNLADDDRALLIRVRRELHRLLGALAAKDWEAARAALRPGTAWETRAIDDAMRAYFEARGAVLAFGDARKAEFTTFRREGPAQFFAWQTLVDPERENDWSIEVAIDLSAGHDDAT